MKRYYGRFCWVLSVLLFLSFSNTVYAQPVCQNCGRYARIGDTVISVPPMLPTARGRYLATVAVLGAALPSRTRSSPMQYTVFTTEFTDPVLHARPSTPTGLAPYFVIDRRTQVDVRVFYIPDRYTETVRESVLRGDGCVGSLNSSTGIASMAQTQCQFSAPGYESLMAQIRCEGRCSQLTDTTLGDVTGNTSVWQFSAGNNVRISGSISFDVVDVSNAAMFLFHNLVQDLDQSLRLQWDRGVSGVIGSQNLSPEHLSHLQNLNHFLKSVYEWPRDVQMPSNGTHSVVVHGAVPNETIRHNLLTLSPWQRDFVTPEEQRLLGDACSDLQGILAVSMGSIALTGFPEQLRESAVWRACVAQTTNAPPSAPTNNRLGAVALMRSSAVVAEDAPVSHLNLPPTLTEQDARGVESIQRTLGYESSEFERILSYVNAADDCTVRSNIVSDSRNSLFWTRVLPVPPNVAAIQVSRVIDCTADSNGICSSLRGGGIAFARLTRRYSLAGTGQQETLSTREVLVAIDHVVPSSANVVGYRLRSLNGSDFLYDLTNGSRTTISDFPGLIELVREFDAEVVRRLYWGASCRTFNTVNTLAAGQPSLVSQAGFLLQELRTVIQGVQPSTDLNVSWGQFSGLVTHFIDDLRALPPTH